MGAKAKFEVGEIVVIDWGDKTKEFCKVESIDFLSNGEIRYSFVGDQILHPVESVLRKPSARELKLRQKDLQMLAGAPKHG